MGIVSTGKAVEVDQAVVPNAERQRMSALLQWIAKFRPTAHPAKLAAVAQVEEPCAGKTARVRRTRYCAEYNSWIEPENRSYAGEIPFMLRQAQHERNFLGPPDE